jgi:hypothetical protein
LGLPPPTSTTGIPNPQRPFLSSADHVILYYVASSKKDVDTFFRHGIYVLDTSGPLGKTIIPTE